MPYCIALTRAQTNQVELWPIALPTVLPVPLAAPDGDVPLDLQAALGAIYEEAAYDLSVDYSQLPPPPAFSEAEANWIQAQAQR